MHIDKDKFHSNLILHIHIEYFQLVINQQMAHLNVRTFVKIAFKISPRKRVNNT